MSLLDRLLGTDIEARLKSLEDRVTLLEELNATAESKAKARVLMMLKESMTTVEVAAELKKSRSWASHILNKLEKEGRVVESGKKDGHDLYVRKDANKDNG